MILGMDLGGSAVKVVGMEGEKLCLTHYEHNSPRTASRILRELLEREGLKSGDVAGVAVTGLGAERCDIEKTGLPFARVPELPSIGRGAAFLAGVDRAVVASFGTGTAFIRADGDSFTHLGGTGVGGGTLVGLGGRILGCRDPEEIDRMARTGDLGRVDLTIGDLCSGGGSLPADMTASNLAKAGAESTAADWAAGILNLVLQVVGSMAVFCAKGCGLDTVVVTGTPAALPAARAAYEKFQEMYGLRFLVPDRGRFATAMGAALQWK